LLGEEVCVIGFDLLREETRLSAGCVDAGLAEANKRGVDVLRLLAMAIEKAANGNLRGFLISQPCLRICPRQWTSE
jgi:hypothetical protein